VRFGYADDTTYRLVDRNEHWRDFHTPRLNKLVTEVAPVSVTDAGTGKGVYQNRSRYPVFYRMGSGTQYTGAASGALTRIADAYAWKTGGTVGSPVISDWSLVSNPGNLYQSVNGPLASYGTPGDSGSPLFAWDAVKKQFPKLDFCVRPGKLLDIPYVAKDIDPLAAHPDQSPSTSTLNFNSFVTVMTGCDNCCSYCIVPKTRGHEYSRPMDDIVREVECLAKRGVKEVTLLGQSVLRYRDFPGLLRRLQPIEGLERIRFTSAHPKGCTDELLAAYRDCPKVCRHLHLPVQSGSDRILKEMGRRYTREEYLSAVKKLREFDPEFALTTDVIVGYPGETEADFEATRSLMEEAGFDNAFVFKYSPRPGTRSAELEDDVPVAEKERRDQVLLADQEERGLKRNQALVGTVREVLVEGPSKRNSSRWSGRDSGNRIVVWDRGEVGSKKEEVGSLVKVKIIEAHPQILVGEICPLAR